jgi:hypothetical protein
MAAALQKLMKDSITVVATTTFVATGFCAKSKENPFLNPCPTGRSQIGLRS